MFPTPFSSSPLTRPEKNLILTGYTEPNKPRIGRQVAAQLGLPFVDVEEEIEKQLGDTIENARARFGEKALQTAEQNAMSNLVLYRGYVIRANGSFLVAKDVVAQGIYETLRQNSYILCLVAPLGAILQRLHLTLGARYHDPNERAMAIGSLDREWAVRKLEGVIERDMGDKREDEIIADILAWWRENAVLRG